MIITLKQVIPHIIWDLPPQTFKKATFNHAQMKGSKVSGRQNTSLTQTQKCQKLEDNDLKQIATHDSRKLS
jgi:hypothetical protein